MADNKSSHLDGGSPNSFIKTNIPEVAVPTPNVQDGNARKLSKEPIEQNVSLGQDLQSTPLQNVSTGQLLQSTLQQNVSMGQPLQPTLGPICYQYNKESVNTVTASRNIGTSSASLSQTKYPQVVYIPQPLPAAAVQSKPPLCFRQTCYEVIVKSVIHVWYLVYICTFLFGVYVYRLPAYNENLKLQIELAKIRLREEEIRSNARVREAEIHRDLTVDVEKLKLGNEHTRQMESLKISQELAEKYLESNVEVKEMSSGFFSKETTTQKKTFLESADTAAFSQLFKGYNNFGIKMLMENDEDLTDEDSMLSEDTVEEVVDEIENLADGKEDL